MDQLLDILAASGLGAYIEGIFCGALMYADDLTLIANSPDELQGMLNIVHSYAKKWRYSINADKSAVMVFGESAKSRDLAENIGNGVLGPILYQKLMSSII